MTSLWIKKLLHFLHVNTKTLLIRFMHTITDIANGKHGIVNDEQLAIILLSLSRYLHHHLRMSAHSE
jgi:flagellar biosynthesis protein FliR